MEDCRRILFYRPVRITDICWEVKVPQKVIDHGEEAIVEWIMANRDRIEKLSEYPHQETYSLREGFSPQNWDEWKVTIYPAINVVEEEEDNDFARRKED